jgi:electron transfer flavoprotein alpha subunit
MAGILVYALHDDEGNFNKNSLGAISEAAKLAGEVGGEAAALVVGEVADDACASLGNWGAAKVYRAKSVPEGLAQPIVDAMAKVIQDNGISYALFGGGLLGFEIGAGLTARLGAGVTMEVTAVKVQDGKLVVERPILQDSQVADVGYVSEPGIIIGRLNAFDAKESGGSAEVVDVEVELSPWSSKAKLVQRGEQRGADVNIEDAEILVGGGRGLGAAEGFKQCEELAEAMGGAVAALAERLHERAPRPQRVPHVRPRHAGEPQSDAQLRGREHLRVHARDRGHGVDGRAGQRFGEPVSGQAARAHLRPGPRRHDANGFALVTYAMAATNSGRTIRSATCSSVSSATRCWIHHTLPNGSRTRPTLSPQNSSVGSVIAVAPAAVARRKVSSASST